MGMLFESLWGYFFFSPFLISEYSRLKLEPPYGDVIRISMGAQKLDKASKNSINMEEFLAGLRFEQRGKIEELPFKY
jgi:hypothetical protein